MKLFSVLVVVSMVLFACKKDKKSTGTNTVPVTTSGGTITLTMNGQTYTSTSGVNALIIDGKFMGCTDSNQSGGFDYKIGDSEEMDLTTGSTAKIAVIIHPGGVNYGAAGYFSPGVTLTITEYNGSKLKGSFTGEVTLDGDPSNPGVPVNGTFETTDLTIL